jgi:hypothetical protein
VTRQTITERLAAGGGPRRRAAAAGGAIVVVAAAIGVIVSAGAPAASKGQASAPASTGATTVQRRNLVQTDTESGTLGYANAQTVFNRLSGTVTYLPKVGQVVTAGGTLYQVDGYPVILFNGSYPAFRSLTSGDGNGRDIQELNADLKAMGFDSGNAITVDRTWQAATTAAVERFQGSIGQTETGTISLGQIVFLPGPQLINTVDTNLGSTGGSAGSGSGTGSGASATGASNSNPTSTPTNASYQPIGQPHAEFVGLTTSSAVATTPAVTTPTTPGTTTPSPTTTTPTTTTPMSGTPAPSGSSLEAIIQLLRTQNKLLQAELKAAAKSSKSPSGAAGSTTAKSGGGSGGSASAGGATSSGGGGSASAGGATSSGGGASPASTGSGSGSGGSSGATAILSTTSTNLVVTVDLDATKQSEAKLREPVTVQLPDGSTVNGRITAVSPVATATSSGSSSSSPSTSAPSATIPVTISLDKHANTRGLDQAAVSVNFAQQVANHVLSVPVTALLATQGGGYAVQEAAAPHKLIPVTPGLFAAGYVQISGPQVQDGMQVTDSQG